MKHCPKCYSTELVALDTEHEHTRCSKCNWQGKYTETFVKAIELSSPPTCGRITIHEERYLQHCANIARIIAHGQSQTIIESWVRMYLRITEERETT